MINISETEDNFELAMKSAKGGRLKEEQTCYVTSLVGVFFPDTWCEDVDGERYIVHVVLRRGHGELHVWTRPDGRGKVPVYRDSRDEDPAELSFKGGLCEIAGRIIDYALSIQKETTIYA